MHRTTNSAHRMTISRPATVPDFDMSIWLRWSGMIPPTAPSSPTTAARCMTCLRLAGGNSTVGDVGGKGASPTALIQAGVGAGRRSRGLIDEFAPAGSQHHFHLAAVVGALGGVGGG